jgi:hypothetical protein
MISETYEQVRRNLFGGHVQNSLVQFLQDRSCVSKPLQGSPEEFCQVLYELTKGELTKKNGTIAYESVARGNKDLLKFQDGSYFRVVKAKLRTGEILIVISPYLTSIDDLLEAEEKPIARLVNDVLMIRDAYKRVADEYRREEARLTGAQAAREIRMTREARIDNVLETIEKARSGATIMVRGQQNIDALRDLGFVPGLFDNPDNWIDAEYFPGLRYRHEKSGIEMLLIGREKFRPIEELTKMEYHFLVHRSDGERTNFLRMLGKFRQTRPDGSPYPPKDFHADLLALVKYPEELKGRSEEDLGLMADEVEHVIDRRQEVDKGLLPYEAVFHKDTMAIVDYVRKNRLPAGEIRKALDYFEYTGMIDAQYKAHLQKEIEAVMEARPAAGQSVADLLYDKRVKEIVSEVLKKIPKENLTSLTITVAMTPYVGELGFGKLVRIRERILQLKAMVHDQ